VVGCGDASQSVEVRDVAGRTILAQRCEVSKKGRFVLNLTGLKPGVYFVEVGEEGKRTSAKLVKQ